MKKQTGAIMLVAGTCIGSGMIALPMLLAKIGIIPSIILMLAMWYIVYYTSLISVEINLQSGRGTPLGGLAKKYSGKIAEVIGTLSFKTLSYALMSVYIYGGTSILQKMLESSNYNYSFFSIASFYALIIMLILILPIKALDYINRLLFVGLLSIVFLLMSGLLTSMNWSDLPLFSKGYNDILTWSTILPVLFTSFGFQVIFHTLTNYCNNDAKILKKAFFWGSLIPAVAYILWTCSILGSVHQNNQPFYIKMINGEVEVGELIKELSLIAKWQFVQLLVWWISLLAIVTSILGIGMGLKDSLNSILENKIQKPIFLRLATALITILPAYIVAILIPNAFIAVLGFAGMILVIIAILLPIYLLNKVKKNTKFYPELNSRLLIWISIIVGLIIILCQVRNILF